MTRGQIEKRLTKKGWHLIKCNNSEYNLVLNDKSGQCAFCNWGTIWSPHKQATNFERQYLIWPYNI